MNGHPRLGLETVSDLKPATASIETFALSDTASKRLILGRARYKGAVRVTIDEKSNDLRNYRRRPLISKKALSTIAPPGTT